MTVRELLLREIKQASDNVINKTLDFLHKTQSDNEIQPFWQFIEELTADIPPEILETLPKNSSEQT